VARRIEVDIIGDASSLQKTFRQTAAGTQKFEHSMTSSLGRVNESFKGLAKTALLSTGAFVGVAGLAEGFKTVVGAAEGAEVAQRSLGAQLKANQESFRVNQAAIDKAGLSLSKYGFTIKDSEEALTVLDRATGNISRSIQIQGVAANVAAARNKTLSWAALILGKAYDGQTASLKRLGVELPKGAKGMQAINVVAQKFAGQAAANATSLKAFHAALFNTEVIIGRALLPTFNRLLDRLTVWLEKMNRSGRLQRDVNQAMQTATGIIDALRGPVEGLAKGFKDLGDVVGGSKNEVKLLGTAFAAWKVSGWLTALTGLTGSVKGVGTAAETSAGQVRGLRGALTRLGAMGAIGVTVAVSYEVAKGGEWLSRWLGKQGIPELGDKNIPQGALADFARRSIAAGMSRSKFIEAAGLGGQSKQDAAAVYDAIARSVMSPLTGLRGLFKNLANLNVGASGLPGTVGGKGTYNAPLTAWQRLQMSLAGDPNNVSLLRQRIQHDQAALNFLETLHKQNRITNKAYLAEYQAYYGDINSTLATIASVTKQAATAAKHAAIHLPGVVGGTAPIPGLGAYRVTERQSLLGGLQSYLRTYGPIGAWQVPMNLQIAQARAQAFGGDQAPILRRIKEAALRVYKSGRLFGQGYLDVLNTIAGINQQLGVQTIKFRRDLRGTQPAYAFAGGHTTVIHGGLHLHGVQDVTAMENALEARAKRRPQPRRGR
jgi:hypothetical protein